jgi:pimeloyl-ACP methyl ester carboxylesterase
VPNATVAGATIHYESAGEGRPLVLLHGIGSNSRSWRRQLTELSKDFRVIAWDAPGYGSSSDPSGPPSMRYYATCLRGLLDALRLKRIFLLGHSMGGVIAQEFYRSHAEFVDALILADTSSGGWTAGAEQRLKMIRTMTPAQIAADRAPRLLSPSATNALIREAESIMAEIRPAGYEFAAIALAESDTGDVLRHVRVPMLLIWGDQDEITPVWKEVPAAARTEIIPNAGHLCYAEQPDKFNAIVREFLI